MCIGFEGYIGSQYVALPRRVPAAKMGMDSILAMQQCSNAARRDGAMQHIV